VKSTRRTLSAATGCLILILLAGCAALSPLTTKQETLEERVKNYMQAQIDGKWDYAYSFFDASSRQKVAREGYVHQTRKVSCKGFAIEEITVLPSGDQATVKVRMHISFMGYDFERAPQTQNWVKEKGAWFVNSQPRSRTTPFTTQEKQK
jgi:hypothetical protein